MLDRQMTHVHRLRPFTAVLVLLFVLPVVAQSERPRLRQPDAATLQRLKAVHRPQNCLPIPVKPEFRSYVDVLSKDHGIQGFGALEVTISMTTAVRGATTGDSAWYGDVIEASGVEFGTGLKACDSYEGSLRVREVGGAVREGSYFLSFRTGVLAVQLSSAPALRFPLALQGEDVFQGFTIVGKGSARRTTTAVTLSLRGLACTIEGGCAPSIARP